MSDKLTGEWTLSGCCIRVQDGAIICVDDASRADTLRQYHNAALAAEREISKRFEIQVDDCHQQLAAEREKVQALVDALNLVRKALCSGGGLREATDIIDDALAKVNDRK